MTDKVKLGTESYKGVRDFYPEDEFIQNYIFNTWKDVVESFGYAEYNSSILEPAELYKQKSGEEIVNEQTYTFKDRGDREVTLRPEMTPSVARMVAQRIQDLPFPLRWFSIPNLFRYEKPQKGRLREHWQLNVDLFGADGVTADAEVINIAYQIMKKFGAKDEDFIVKINDRKIINALYDRLGLDEDTAYKVSKIIDKKDKISSEVFESTLSELIGDKSKELVHVLNKNEDLLLSFENKDEVSKDLVSLIEKLQKLGVNNVIFDPSLMRGFDYYTGIVFEIFDTHPDNNRSVFGGGRYDDLLEIFGSKKVTGMGFGAGDVTTRDFLESHGLLPKYTSSTKIYICSLGSEFEEQINNIAKDLRDKGINVAVDLSGKKLGDQIKIADRQSIPYILCVGENEVKSGEYPLKNLDTGEEKKVKIEEILANIK